MTAQTRKKRRRTKTLATAKIRSDGRITLPKAVRDQFGFQPGERVAFIKDEHGITLLRYLPRDYLRKWHEYAKDLDGVDVDALIDEMRGRNGWTGD